MLSQFLSKFSRSADEHTDKRNVRLLLSVFTSVLAKFIAIGSTLITIPVTLSYLGAEGFGVWMVISGVVGFMGFSDLGVGMGLQNALSKACGQDDKVSPRRYIANAYFLLVGLSAGLILILLVVFSILPLDKLFKIEDEILLVQAIAALKYSILAFVFGVPVALIQRVLGGIQKTYIANNVVLVGSILSLLAILSAVYFDLGLIGLSVLFVLSPTVALLIYSIYFFIKNSEFSPSFSGLSSGHFKPVVAAGVWTVFVQIVYTAKMNIPTVIISASLGLLAVAEYSIAQKLTGLAATMISMALQPLWVVYGEAYYRGDKVWVVNTLKKSIGLVFLTSVFAAVGFQFVGQPLINLWLGSEVLPSQILILGFSLWMIASNINICFSMLLNGTGNFKNQAIFSFVCVGLMIIVANFYSVKFGVIGIIFTVFLVAELLRMPFFYFEAKKVLRRL